MKIRKYMRYTIYMLMLVIFASPAMAQVDRSEPPEPGPAPEIKLGDYEFFQLDNGLKVFVVENEKLPTISYSLIIDRDPIKEGEKAGYLDIAGEMIGTATSNRSKDELNEEIDFIGGSLYTGSTNVYASALTKHKEKLMDIFSDVIRNSTFSEEELNKVVLQMKSSLQASENQPNVIASRVFDKLVYQDHPYAEVETVESVEKVTLDDVQKYYQTYWHPNTAYLAVVGNTNAKEVKKLIQKNLGNWEKSDIPEKEYQKPEELSQTKVALVHRPDAVQSSLRIGHIANLEVGSEEVIKAKVTNTILGGGAFRLFNNLREEHAYTYGAYSQLEDDDLIGYFTASAEVRNEVTDSAIQEILNEMNRIREEEVPEDELNRAKNYMTGNFALNLEDPRTIASYAINVDRYDMPEDYYSNYLKNIEDVDAGDVQEMAKKYIQPDKSYIVVVGNANEVMDKLNKFGKVVYLDAYGSESKPPETKEIPNDMTGEMVIDEYLQAIGGKEALEDVETLIMEYKGSMAGNDVTSKTIKRRPNLTKEIFAIPAMGMTQTMVFDGEKAMNNSPMGKKEITGDDLEAFKTTANIFYLTNMQELGISANLKGIEEMDGEEAYKVELSTSADNKWTEYFSTETGLKIAESKVLETPQGEMVQTVHYGNYEEHDGIKFPGSIKMSVGPGTIEMNLENVEINSKVKKSTFDIPN